MKLQLVREYLDYFLPREVMGPVIIVFSMENVVEILFNRYLPLESELMGWSSVLLISIIIVAYWGESDEEMEKLEDELEEKGLKEPDQPENQQGIEDF